MSYVEQASFLPCPFVTFSHAEVRVLDWHGVASECNHLAAVVDMDLVESSLVEAGILERSVA